MMVAGHALADRLTKRASKIMGDRGILISVLRNSMARRSGRFSQSSAFFRIFAISQSGFCRCECRNIDFP